MIRLKFWQKESPIEETPPPYVEDDLDFWGFVPVDWESDPEFVPLGPVDLASDWESSRTPTDEQSEYMSQFTDFTHWKARKPLAPRSALLSPPKLTLKEKEAIALFETVTQYIDGLDVKLKPTLAKKKRESEKGYRRVVFDDKGKMKVVKGA